MKIGFTGTQRGTTEQQRRVLSDLLMTYKTPLVDVAIHGDCIGADVDFGYIASCIGYRIETRPGCDWQGNTPKRAFSFTDKEYPVEPYLDRNKKIVEQCNVLFACPGEDREQQRSGTWSTIRYALKVRKPVTIIYPGSNIQEYV